MSLFVILLLRFTTSSVVNEDLEKYEWKLRHYQNLTGISEEDYQIIWKRGIEKCKVKRFVSTFRDII